jgi:hypothetical protein
MNTRRGSVPEPPDLKAGSNRLFRGLDLYWRSPESRRRAVQIKTIEKGDLQVLRIRRGFRTAVLPRFRQADLVQIIYRKCLDFCHKSPDIGERQCKSGA